MSHFCNEYEYNYERIAQDTDELYDFDYNDDETDTLEEEWENYYHNLTDEIIED